MSTKPKRKSEGDGKKNTSDSFKQTSLLRYTKTKSSTPKATSTPTSSASKVQPSKVSRGGRRPHTQKESVISSLTNSLLPNVDVSTQLELANSNMSPGGNSSSSRSSSIPGLYAPETSDNREPVPTKHFSSAITSTVAGTYPRANASQGRQDAKRKAQELDIDIISLSDDEEKNGAEKSSISRPHKRIRKTISPRSTTSPFRLSNTLSSSSRRISHTATPLSSAHVHTPVPRSSSVVSSSTNSHYSPFKPLFDDVDLQSGHIIESSQSQHLQNSPFVQSSQSQYLSPLRPFSFNTNPIGTEISSNKQLQGEDSEASAPRENYSFRESPSYGQRLLSLSQRPPTPPIITAPGEKIRRRRPGRYSLSNSNSITRSTNDVPPSSLLRLSSVISLSDDDTSLDSEPKNKERVIQSNGTAVPVARKDVSPSYALLDRHIVVERHSRNNSGTETETETGDEDDNTPKLSLFRTDGERNPFLDNLERQNEPALSLPLFQPPPSASQRQVQGTSRQHQCEEFAPIPDADKTLVSVDISLNSHSDSRTLASSNGRRTHQHDRTEIGSSEDPDRTLINSTITRHNYDRVKSLVRGMEGMSPFRKRVLHQEDYGKGNNDDQPQPSSPLAASPPFSKFESQLPFEESIPVMSIPHGWGESQLLGQVPDEEVPTSKGGLTTRYGGLATPEKLVDGVEQDSDWPSAVKRFEQQPSPYAGMFSGSTEDSTDESSST